MLHFIVSKTNLGSSFFTAWSLLSDSLLSFFGSLYSLDLLQPSQTITISANHWKCMSISTQQISSCTYPQRVETLNLCTRWHAKMGIGSLNRQMAPDNWGKPPGVSQESFWLWRASPSSQMFSCLDCSYMLLATFSSSVNIFKSLYMQYTQNMTNVLIISNCILLFTGKKHIFHVKTLISVWYLLICIRQYSYTY